MTALPILVTGFEPFAGLDRNPSAEVAGRLDGRIIGGGKVAARLLPVSLAGYRGALAAALDEVRPGLVIALGLAEREATVRIERVGVNLADFEIADSDGTVAAGWQLEEAGPQARFSTFPSTAIEVALLAEGIPAHCSTTAGTYLCNACLYSLLGMTEKTGAGIVCGFIHLPYLPEQVAGQMSRDRRHGHAVPSMGLDMMVRAVEIAIGVSLGVSAGAMSI